MIIYLLRHGMTLANEKRIYYGSTDLSLSERGVEELKRLKMVLRLPIADCHLTSGLRRAKESLWILFDKTPQRTIDELNEYDFGDFEMKSHEELKNNPDYVRWMTGDDTTPCPNGESKSNFTQRIWRGFEIVKNMEAARIVVVCHGGVIGMLMHILFPTQNDHEHAWIPECGRGYAVEMSDERLTYQPI